MKTEFDRLIERGLTPEEETIARRYYSQKERESMDESAFCGPHRSFPVTSQEDVHNAATLLHHADDPQTVKRCIVTKAHEHGWDLPATWTEEKSETPSDIRGQHGPMTGKHAHPHPAFGDQGDDQTHVHTHSHDNDSEHDHSHADTADAKPDGKKDDDETEKAATPEIVRSMPSETTFFAPILRIDARKREVVVRATAEDLDSYNTVIGFDASKEAFGKWRGNIREMHDPTKAVGRSIKWEPVDQEKAIDLTLRVSRGAEDTWQKLLDGTLAGASIGARNGKWGKRQWNGKEVPFLERYDLVEVSLVDNPSCPGCDVKIVRADGIATDVLDFTEEETPTEERKGARVSTNTKSNMHDSRDHALMSVRSLLSNCGCADCQRALKIMDPDLDGDVDILNDDGDAASGDGSGVMKAATAEITRILAPYITRMNTIAARLASVPDQDREESPEITRALSHMTQNQPDMIRRLDALEQKLNGLDEVRSTLVEVKDLAEKIAAQPQSGGPIVNSTAMRNMAADPQANDSLEAEVIARLARSGILNKDQQVNAVLYLQRLQQQGMSARR